MPHPGNFSTALEQLELGQVLGIDDAHRRLAVVDDDQVVDAMTFEEVQHFHGEFVLVDGHRIQRHEITYEPVSVGTADWDVA